MKYFYRIIEDNLEIGSGTRIPDGFTEYKKGNEPKELRHMLDKKALEKTKNTKKQELYSAKETYLTKPININGKLFFASETAYAKYKIAYNLGVKKGLTEGEVILLVDNNPAWATVTKEEMENYFEAFELQGYKAERKLGYYLEALQQAKTEEEINAIVWEDVRDEEQE